jgi:hypothetical protein
MTDCPACGVAGAEVFLTRGGVPVHQNFLFATEDAAKNTIRGDLRMAVCHACGFVFNAAFDPARITYGEEYDNTQICSPFFDTYVDELVRHIVAERGVRGQTIVEVGCGKGYFLQRVVEADSHNRGFGFDTTYAGPSTAVDGRVTFRRSYYDEHSRDVVPDVVICRHVIEHVPQPADILRSIRMTLDAAPHAMVFFETPCVEWILRNRVIWDFFYEHCSLFSAASLASLFERCGYAVDGVRHVFNDQYLWLEARPGAVRETGSGAAAIVAGCREFSIVERDLLDGWRSRLRALAGDGRVALWGAGAKGVTFANLIDPDRKTIDCIVDLNPQKQGHFVAGTGHSIVSHVELAERGVRHVALMNPNYESENRALAAAAGLTLDFIV